MAKVLKFPSAKRIKFVLADLSTCTEDTIRDLRAALARQRLEEAKEKDDASS